MPYCNVCKNKEVIQMKPLVSVIVPVYNTEEYLPRAVESIREQTYAKLEIILVDDGSTDRSGKICGDYAAKDERIHVIHQSNRGIIAAKKAAIRECHGEYVMFVDSDDWIEDRYVDAMLCHMLSSGCALVCMNIWIHYGEKTVVETRNEIPAGIYETDKIARDIFLYRNTTERGILPYSVLKLYKRELLTRALERIGNDIVFAEDSAILFGIVFQNIRICIADEGYYHYYIRENSVCRTVNPDYLIELTAFYKYAKQIFEEHVEREHLLRQLGIYLLERAKEAVNLRLGLTSEALPIYRQDYEIDFSVFFTQKKTLILYGAGKVGQDYYKKLSCLDYRNICFAGWVDKNYEKYREAGFDVQPVESIRDREYDNLLVAVMKENVFNEIKEELKDMGVIEDKIVWGRPLQQ